MSRSRSLALLTAAALTAALAPAALASAAVPVSADKAKSEHDRIVEYWTPERMKAAKPRDFVRQKDGSFTLAPTPKAGRPNGGGGGLTFPAAEGSSMAWPEPAKDEPPAEVQARTGKIYFTLGRSGYVCSGAVVADAMDNLGSVVLTAAHCAYDWRKGYAAKWLFIPDFDTTPVLNTSACSSGGRYGCWTARTLLVPEAFRSAGSFNRQAINNDFAFAVVGLGGRTDQSLELDSVVGGYAIATTDPPALASANAFGYPAAAPFDGKVLRYSSGTVFSDPYAAATTWGLPSDMTGGSSGGPWLDESFSSDTSRGGKIASLNSYGYSGYKYMFGPKFNGTTQALYDEAKGQVPTQ